MDDFKVDIVVFLIRSGFEFGEDFSMDANGDLIIGNPDTFAALTELLDSLKD
ncbi:MAG TPA: hypothetical protein V6C63_11620 [Allocoleopsis sp.]